MLAVFSKGGEIKEKVQFPTPDDYDEFKKLLAEYIAKLSTNDFRAAGVAIPGRVDRRHGVGISLGNLPWRNFPIQTDLETMLHCPVVLENDAKAAALSEALNIIHEFKRVLYVTIGTGIGTGLVNDGVLDTSTNDLGGKGMLVVHQGKRQEWESFASGRAIVKRFGKKASEIHDEKIWRTLAEDFANGILDLIARYQPDAVVIGGGVGSHFNHFGKFLNETLKRYETPLMSMPPVRSAEHAVEAVVIGCFHLAKKAYE